MKASPWLLAAAFAYALGATSAHAQTVARFDPCGAELRENALLKLKQSSATPDADLAAAQAAIASAAKTRDDTLAGREVPAPYDGPSRWARLASQASSPDVAELYRRIAKDQLIRHQGIARMTGKDWAAGLSDLALNYAYVVVLRDGCGVDEGNTAWLKARLKTHGWFTIGEYGKEADNAAFLLVQHADRDPEFQAEVLPLLEKLALKGETRPAGYALLYDRVAVAQKRPQRYGSQGTCNGKSVWTAFETEDPANLDQRRASMGLQPAADYVASISTRACKRP
ncbi:DUF6624 domain-containing protein [Caulobacter segnis]